jgi:hypothetical protein
MPELKPCPWAGCGYAVGEEPRIKAGGIHDGQYGFAVVCGCCGARGPIVVGESRERDAHLKREEAARRWNDRT